MANLFLLGIDEHTPSELVTNIRLSNILSVALVGLISFYTVLSVIVMPELLPFCIMGFFAYAATLLLNYYGLHLAGRLLLGISPIVVISLLHAIIVSAAETPSIPILYFQLIAALLPIAIFSRQELGPMFGVFLFNLILFSNFDALNAWIEYDVDNSFFKQPIMKFAITAGAISFGGFILFFLQWLNGRQSNKNLALVEQVRHENEKAAAKEDELRKSLAELEMAQAEEKKRSWIADGLGQVNSLLRSEDDLQAFSLKLVSFIVKYMGVNQGGLFLAENLGQEDAYLELRAAYAYDRQKHLKKKVQPGEGLLGQSFLEKDYIYVDNIPKDYVQITSGLGEATPTYLLIVPMLVNDEAHGIFELASFHPIPQHKITFMVEMGETVATSISSFKNRQRTKKLLEESQLAQEQMLAQEEEMRQNVEELQATQEASARMEDELRKQKELLEVELEKAQKENDTLKKQLALQDN